MYTPQENVEQFKKQVMINECREIGGDILHRAGTNLTMQIDTHMNVGAEFEHLMK